MMFTPKSWAVVPSPQVRFTPFLHRSGAAAAYRRLSVFRP